MAANDCSVAPAASHWPHRPESAKFSPHAVAEEELEVLHDTAHDSKVKNSDMYRSYSAWPRSVLRSRRSSLMTLML